MSSKKPAGTRWIGVTEMATVTGLSSDGIRLHCKSGTLPAFRQDGRWFVRRELWERWLEERELRGQSTQRAYVAGTAKKRTA